MTRLSIVLVVCGAAGLAFACDKDDDGEPAPQAGAAGSETGGAGGGGGRSGGSGGRTGGAAGQGPGGGGAETGGAAGESSGGNWAGGVAGAGAQGGVAGQAGAAGATGGGSTTALCESYCSTVYMPNMGACVDPLPSMETCVADCEGDAGGDCAAEFQAEFECEIANGFVFACEPPYQWPVMMAGFGCDERMCALGACLGAASPVNYDCI